MYGLGLGLGFGKIQNDGNKNIPWLLRLQITCFLSVMLRCWHKAGKNIMILLIHIFIFIFSEDCIKGGLQKTRMLPFKGKSTLNSLHINIYIINDSFWVLFTSIFLIIFA